MIQFGTLGWLRTVSSQNSEPTVMLEHGAVTSIQNAGDTTSSHLEHHSVRVSLAMRVTSSSETPHLRANSPSLIPSDLA